MRWMIAILIFCSIHQQLNAQYNHTSLASKEDSLKYYGNQIVHAEFPEQRFRADSQFTRMLVRALQIQHSFHYPFDSLTTISRLYSPDSLSLIHI